MKKIVLTICVLALMLCLSLGAFACSNVNQINFISVVARDYEHYTYTLYEQADDAAKTLTAIGTYTYTFRRLQPAAGQSTVSYTLNGAEYTLVSGGVISTELTITEGEYKGDHVTCEVLFQNAYSPIASHKVYIARKGDQEDAERSYDTSLVYTAKKQVSITVKANGEDKTSTFKKPNYCYDNDTLYSVVRGSDISRSSYSLTVAGVDNLMGGTRSVSIALVSTNLSLDVPCLSAEPVVTTCVMLGTIAQYGASTTTSIYFLPSYRLAVGDATVDLNKVPVRIDEGKYIYKLDAVSVTEE